MKLSTRAKYGLKALIDLGLYSEKEAVSLQSIAGRQNISVSYLEQLMALLKKAGLVKSVRGAAGGFLRRRSTYPAPLFAWRTQFQAVCHRVRQRSAAGVRDPAGRKNNRSAA